MIELRCKGWPDVAASVEPADVAAQGWNIFDGGFPMPVMVLKRSALRHNIDTMAGYCRRHEVSLAPHGKTTMSPEIVAAQLEAGAWGITAATVSQARAFRSFGVQRVFLANEVIDPAGLRWMAAELDRNPGFEIFCLVDSPACVEVMEDVLGRSGSRRAIPVLLEVGVQGGRTGCRTKEEAMATAGAVGRAAHLELAGVEAYEGVIHADPLSRRVEKVHRFLAFVRDLTADLAGAGAFRGRAEVIVSAGGSAFFDVVVEALGPPWDLDSPVRTLLRSGCYVTHDSGMYRSVSPFDGRSSDGAALRAAIEVWGAVLSRPEPHLAIVGMGKRDAPYDVDLPAPERIRRRADGALQPAEGMEVFELNDQHAYVRVDGEGPGVGDLLGCGISHPCTAFDKWRLIPLVDDDYSVVGAVRTFF